MKYFPLMLMCCGLCSFAAAENMEITWIGGYFFRPVDDGIEHDGPGSGVVVSRLLSHNWWAEGEVLFGWNTLSNTDTFSVYSREWSSTRILGGVYKRWPSGRTTLFAGASVGTTFNTESWEMTYTLPDENDIPRAFHDSDRHSDNGMVIAGKVGAIVNIHSGLVVRIEAELAPSFIPNIGTTVGLGWRF